MTWEISINDQIER